jgi:hypothetical protein
VLSSLQHLTNAGPKKFASPSFHFRSSQSVSVLYQHAFWAGESRAWKRQVAKAGNSSGSRARVNQKDNGSAFHNGRQQFGTERRALFLFVSCHTILILTLVFRRLLSSTNSSLSHSTQYTHSLIPFTIHL